MSVPPQHSADHPIYLDHAATTPVAPPVVDAMRTWLDEQWGNPASAHAFGRRAHAAVERAHAAVGRLLGVDADEIVLTSGGTEADNMALFGVEPSSTTGGRAVISSVEHPAVAEPARALEQRGWTVERLEVDAEGVVDLGRARRVLERPADLVSVILAQNETGVVQPVSLLARMARAANPAVVVHTDAAQAVGKIPVSARELDVDLLTVVGHKMYAPKGIGALFVRRGLALRPLLCGGGQEGGRRPGTENVASAVALGVACAVAAEGMDAEAERQRTLRERGWQRLSAGVAGLHRTGAGASTLPGTLHVCFPGVDGKELLARAQIVAASTGSACHAGAHGPPAVLTAMGVAPALARGAVRLSLGRGTTAAHIDAATDALVVAWRALTRA